MNKLEELEIKTEIEQVIPIIFWKNGKVTVDEEDLEYLRKNIKRILEMLGSF